ncbi:MAG: hypothetical protein ACP5O7_03425 [Phycisphaerae bacterium]
MLRKGAWILRVFEGCQVVVWSGEKTVFFESVAVSKYAWILGGFKGRQDKSGKTLGFCRRPPSSVFAKVQKIREIFEGRQDTRRVLRWV